MKDVWVGVWGSCWLPAVSPPMCSQCLCPEWGRVSAAVSWGCDSRSLQTAWLVHIICHLRVLQPEVQDRGGRLAPSEAAKGGRARPLSRLTAPSLACRWPSSARVFMWASLRLHVRIPACVRAPVLGLQPALVTHFSFPAFNQGHRRQGLGLPHPFGASTIPPHRHGCRGSLLWRHTEGHGPTGVPSGPPGNPGGGVGLCR